MYAPNFRSSLLSVSKFCDRKNVFLFTDSKAYGVSLNSSNARLLDQFVNVSQELKSILVDGSRPAGSSVYTVTADKISSSLSVNACKNCVCQTAGDGATKEALQRS